MTNLQNLPTRLVIFKAAKKRMPSKKQQKNWKFSLIDLSTFVKASLSYEMRIMCAVVYLQGVASIWDTLGTISFTFRRYWGSCEESREQIN